MKYRPLGRSGLLVSELALGTMIFGEQSQRSTTPQEAERIIHRFLDAGGNHIDTANVYAEGRSEEIIGRALSGRRHQVVLATKVRFSTGPGPNDAGLSRYHILRGVEDSLRRLQTDVIDLLYMHSWDPLTPLEETLRTFDVLVTTGKVRYIGVSNIKAWHLMKALAISDANDLERFVAAQYQYSLIERAIEFEFSDLFLEEGLGLIPWGPLGGGFLSGKYQPGKRPKEPEEGRLAVQQDSDEEAWVRRSTEKNWLILSAIGDVVMAHPGSTYSQVALAWLLAQPAVASVIIGARTLSQLEDNLGIVELQLNAQEVARLDEVSAPEPGYPYRYLRNYGVRPY
jgi:aryl-alcohol dehydrogenase-like predicted oxidoreductase